MMPDIAVIIPVFGREDVFTTVGFLRGTKEAARLHFIVIDNGNKPELSERLATLADSSCSVVRLPTNRGGSGAYRAGMEAAMGMEGVRYLWLLDDDAMPNEQTLPGLLRVFETEHGEKPVGAVGSAMLGKEFPFRVTEVGSAVRTWRGGMQRRFEFSDIRELGERTDDVDFCAAASLLASREAVEKAGIFADIFIHWDDIDWCYRVRDAGFRVMATTLSTVNHPEDTGKASEWIIYYDVRNSLWFAKRHIPLLAQWLWRYYVWRGRLWCVYHGKKATLRMVDLGVRHAKSGELLMRSELPLKPCTRTIAEIVKDADYVGALARPKDVGEAMVNALKEAGAKNFHVIICRRENTNKVWKYVLAFAAQIRMQFAIWRAKRPVVFQDPFCVANYPLRFFSAEKYFFAASGGKVEILPDAVEEQVSK